MGFPASMMFLRNRAKQCLFLLLIMAVIADKKVWSYYYPNLLI